jgi:hypothetical protein
MTENQLCSHCGHDTRAGSPRFAGRRLLDDERYICSDCADVGRDVDVRGDAPVTMPNTNFPNTH